MFKTAKAKIVLILVCMFLFGLILTLYLPSPDSDSGKKIAFAVNVIAALATFFAVVVALYFGIDAQIKSNNVELGRSSIAAAKLIGRVEHILNRLNWTIQATVYKGSNDGRFRFLIIGMEAEELSEEQLDFSETDLLGLLPIGSDCAPQIALCATELLRIRRSLQSHKNVFERLSSEEEKTELVSGWMNGIQTVSESLSQVHQVLYKATGEVSLGLSESTH